MKTKRLIWMLLVLAAAAALLAAGCEVVAETPSAQPEAREAEPLRAGALKGPTGRGRADGRAYDETATG